MGHSRRSTAAGEWRFVVARRISLFPRLGLDMGTGKTVLWAGNGIICNEPTMLIVGAGNSRVLHTGAVAAERMKKLDAGAELVRPVKRGAIADYAAALFLLRKTLSAAMRSRILRPVIVASMPIQLSSVESRALCDAAREAGAGAIYLVPCNLASMWSYTDTPDQSAGALIVDFGAGVTNISVAASNQLIAGRTIPLGGDDVTALAQRVMEISYGVRMGHAEAEQLKMEIGVDYYTGEIIEKLRTAPEADSTFMKIRISKKQVAESLLKGIEPLFTGILQTLEETPPELFEDIFNRGIMLTGGSSMLPGLGRRLQERLRLNINRLPEPSLSAIRGIGKVLDRFPQYRQYFTRREAV